MREQLLEQRRGGTAILLISEDLDEILALSDRIAVIYEGQIMDILDRVARPRREKLGLLMAGVRSRKSGRIRIPLVRWSLRGYSCRSGVGSDPLEKCRRPSVKAEPHEPLAELCQTQHRF